MKSEIRKLFKITGGGFRFAVLLLLRCPFDAARAIILSLFMQNGFSAVCSKDISGLYTACAAFGRDNAFLFLYNGLVWLLYAPFSIYLIGVLRRKLFLHAASLPLREIESQPSGEWFTRFFGDIEQAMAIFSQPHLPLAATAAVSVCVCAFLLLSFDPLIFAVSALFLAPHIMISRLIMKRVESLAKAAREETAANTTCMNALAICADTAYLYDAQDFLLRRFKEESLRLRAVNMKLRKQRVCVDALLPMLGMSGYLAVLLVGGARISAGDMTFGGLTAAFQYRVGIITGAMTLTNCVLSLKTAMTGVRFLNDMMTAKKEE